MKTSARRWGLAPACEPAQQRWTRRRPRGGGVQANEAVARFPVAYYEFQHAYVMRPRTPGKFQLFEQFPVLKVRGDIVWIELDGLFKLFDSFAPIFRDT